MRWAFFAAAFIFGFAFEACALVLESAAFRNGEHIPEKYSCKGEDSSPPLTWKNAPENTQSFALVCDDPDAPAGTWDHWVIFNIPAEDTSLQENTAKTPSLSSGALQGKNSWGRLGYGGPCPPPGKPHRYFFRLYALDRLLELKAGVGKKEVLGAMKGHVLAEAELMGLFKR